jgi:hypothetical protein
MAQSAPAGVAGGWILCAQVSEDETRRCPNRGSLSRGNVSGWLVESDRRIGPVSPHAQSMSDGPLEPVHDAVAEVFCDVRGRHLV